MAIDKREKRRKKELKKSASHTQSIVDIFLAKYTYNSLYHLATFFNLLPPPISSQKLSAKVIEVVDTKYELQTQAKHNLGKLLHLKTRQIDKYVYKLSHKSNFYYHHQMVRSFL